MSQAFAADSGGRPSSLIKKRRLQWRMGSKVLKDSRGASENLSEMSLRLHEIQAPVSMAEEEEFISLSHTESALDD